MSITTILALIPKNLYQKIKPSLAVELASSKGRLVLQKKINETNKVVYTLITIFALLIIYFSRELLGFFGSDYVAGQKALIILTIGFWYTGLSQFSATILMYANLEGLALKLSVIQLIFIFISTIPATYYYGINGAALSTVIIFVLEGIGCSIMVKRKLGLNSMSF